MKRHIEIHGIIFDLGGVLIPIDEFLLAFFARLTRIAPGRSKEQLKRLINHEEGRSEEGKETGTQFWNRVILELNLRAGQRKDFEKLWSQLFEKYAKVDREVLLIAKRLKKKHKIGIISNTTDDHAAIMKKMRLFEYFDVVILSNEIGARKPQVKIFKRAAKEINIRPRNLLFIDDGKKNVEAARRAGFQALQFKSAKQLDGVLKKMKVL